ncbi:hypothetical protein EZV62_027715 [Acer yangbiense]|uniref:SWIM-type domain-containing protein n=1 Tax=Acer yangbiense TaxID=1000413 RepID=A0A5C7GUM2_9ROSI|nr:hypothetical protein EZV62_027715 [Acer yangbiense]
MHAFDSSIKCDHVTNNMTEAFNSMLKDFRARTYLNLMEFIRRMVMTRFQVRKKGCGKWKSELPPTVNKKIVENSVESRILKIIHAGEGKYELMGLSRTYTAKLQEKICECGAWQISGVPCSHALAGIRHLYGMTPVDPPPIKKKPGIPKLVRKRELHEKPKESKSGSVVCTRCRNPGHNKITCKAIITFESNKRVAKAVKKSSTNARAEVVSVMLGYLELELSVVVGVCVVNLESSNKISSRIAQIRLVSSHPEVYEPCDDSFALVDALLADRNNLLEHRPTLCMEVGCGSGYVITSLALMLGEEVPGVQYIATDTNPHAVEVTRETLKGHGVHAELINTDIASGLEKRLAGLIDVMVVNPPYVPTPEDEVGREGIASAWAGGENGRCVIDKILTIADKLLSDRGWLYMVTLTTNNPSQICLQMREKGYASRIIVQRSTEEESLHIIKFWRDFGIKPDAKENVTVNKTAPARVLDTLLSQVHWLSLKKSGNSNSS